MPQSRARPSLATNELLDRVRREVLDRYQRLGEPAVVVGTGSRVMGFTDDADLDVTVVWDVVPAERGVVLEGLADIDRGVRAFDQPGFQLESFYLGGQQVDVMHRKVADLTDWWSQLCAGDGWQPAQPLPVVALSGLRYGLVLSGELAKVLPDLDTVPAPFVSATARAAKDQITEYMPFLTAAATNGDGWLFHQMLTLPVQTVYIAYFAGHGHLYPFAKRLAQWIDVLGLDRGFANTDQRLWSAADLPTRLAEFCTLAAIAGVAPDR